MKRDVLIQLPFLGKMTEDIVKSLTPSVKAGGHGSGGGLFHRSFLNVIYLHSKYYNSISSYFLFKSR